jgi:16S rRNA (guanine527-N7)-methyltransferase
LDYLPEDAIFADVGTGAGIPSIPCLLVRDDLRAILIESKEKKASFLNEAVTKLSLNERAKIVNRQFAEADLGNSEFITCRALDKFVDVLPKLIKWSGGRKLLLYGGPTLGQALQLARVPYASVLMPMSRERYLFVSRRS